MRAHLALLLVASAIKASPLVIPAPQARAAVWERLKKVPAIQLEKIKWGTERPEILKGKQTVRVSLWHWPRTAPPNRYEVWVGADGEVVEFKDTTPHEVPNVPPEWLVAPAGQEIVFAKTRHNGDQPVTVYEHPGKPFALDGPRATTREAYNDFPPIAEALPITSATYTFGDGTGYEDRKQALYSDNAKTPAGEMQFGIEVMSRFLVKFWNRHSYDNLGGRIDAFAHSGWNYPNAFYAGGSDGSGWCECIYVGDGDPGSAAESLSFTNFSTIEVMGHEFAHAITSYTANFNYWGQSGGLNEASSDILGLALEQWVSGGYPNTIPTPKTLSEWTIGRNILRVEGIPTPFRYFYRPSKDVALYGGNAHSWDTVEPGISEIDVHFSSGPLNRWLFITAVGVGQSDTENGSKYLKEGSDYGVGLDAAVKIWYLALTKYSKSDDFYSDAAANVDKAAIELYGETSQQRAAASAGMLAINAIRRDQAHILPTLTSIDRQVVAPLDTVNLKGGGFTGATVTVGGVPMQATVFGDDWISFQATSSGPVLVTNAMGAAKYQPYLDVAAPPKIRSFSLYPGGFRAGETVTVTWDVEIGNASINGEPIASQGSKAYKPTQDTTFVLLSQNVAGAATWSITAWYRPFDINIDGTVDIFDALEVRARVGTTGNEKTDLNGDSKTDDADLNLLWKEIK